MKIVEMKVYRMSRDDPRFPPEWGSRPVPSSDLYLVEVELEGGEKKECPLFVPIDETGDDLTPSKAHKMLAFMGAVIERMERQETSKAA